MQLSDGLGARYAKWSHLIDRGDKGLTPGGDADLFASRQGGFEVGGAGGSESGDDVVVVAVDVDDDGFGEAVLVFERFFELGVDARGHGDDCSHYAGLAARLRSRETRACER